jgi:hypothetical protein
LSTFRKVSAEPTEAPQWVVLRLKGQKVPALVDTGAQYSCVRADVAEFLRSMGETCEFCLLSGLRISGPDPLQSQQRG